jgi:hypothetical protein
MSSEASKYLKFGSVTVLILLSLGYLAYTGVQDSKSYYVTIKELNGMGNDAYSKRLRVAGNVVPGSIKRSGNARGFHAEGKRSDAARFLYRDRSSSRHFQGRLAGFGRWQLRTRWRFPRQATAGQVRVEVCAGSREPLRPLSPARACRRTRVPGSSGMANLAGNFNSFD